MKITLRAIRADGHHTTFNMFINGTSAGIITLREDEAITLYHIIANGCVPRLDTFLGEGEWVKPIQLPFSRSSAGLPTPSTSDDQI